MTGLNNSGRKKLFPNAVKLTCSPTDMTPAPASAPVKLCVVDMGKPETVARNTVIPAPSPTAVRNSGEPAMISGTRPISEKLLTSAPARNIEVIDPAKVVAVAHRIARL